MSKWKPNVVPAKVAAEPNKTSAGRFVDSSTGKMSKFMVPWTCPSCTIVNKPQNKTCEICKAKQPDRTPLSIAITIPSIPEFATQPLLLTQLKFTLSMAFLRDLLEAKSGIPDAQIMLLYKNIEVHGESDDFLVTCLPGCNPADVIPITLIRTGDASSSTLPGSTGAPKRTPSLRKKQSRTRESPTEDDDAFAGADEGEGWGDDGAAMDDDAGGWGDDADNDDGWENEDEENGKRGVRDEEMEEKETDRLSRAAKAASASLVPTHDGASSSSSSAAAASAMDVSDSSSYASTVTAKTNAYILRKPAQLESHITTYLDEFGELLGLNAKEAGVLMRNFKDSWNRTKIQDAWMNDSEKVRKEAGLGPEKDEDPSQDQEELVSCETCADDVPMKDSLALSCGHLFCNSCWTQWVVAEFDKGPTCIKTRCQGYKCTVMLPSELQATFLPVDKREKLTRWLIDDFVSAHHGTYRACPYSNCVMNAQRIDGVKHVGGVDCTCAHSWCFECGLEDHRPASCEDAKRWNDKNSSDAENVNWILANTKVCPKCQVHIEKNQGCNHVSKQHQSEQDAFGKMTCKKCSHQFCWLCKGDWSGHSSCSNYGASTKGSKELMDVENAQNALKKYMHYWSRFDNHAKSIKFAEKTRKAAEERMVQLQALKGTGLLDVQFIVDSVNAVIINKRILQWLYVYAYYFEAPEGSSDRALFELNQSQLEKFTDELHGLAEAPLEDLVKPEMRVRMISFIATVSKFRKGVMEAVEKSNEFVRQKALENPTASSSPPPAAAASSEPAKAPAAKGKGKK